MKTLEEYLPELKEGHPVRTYLLEAGVINDLMKELQQIDFLKETQKLYNAFNQLSTVEKRFARKENQLFPFLEQYGWDGPSKNMWTVHDRIRDLFRDTRGYFESKDDEGIEMTVKAILFNLKQLLHIEDTVLFPKSLTLLADEDWIKMSKGEEEIGWMLKEAPASYPSEPAYVHPSEDTTIRTDVVFDKEAAHYDEGYMTVEQVNLMFRTFPFDITYVDENDKVVFYNKGDERLFPRSPGVIGREVKYCHPPKSVDKVLEIVANFRAGKQNEAAFWINIKGRLIYIRYFAVRDKDKNYRGVMEVSQDITDLKSIEGERRLIEWK